MAEMPPGLDPPGMSHPPPKVSVAMITYNHENFIAQAIESVLMQETDFPVELVIGEDCSRDGTGRIVEAYAHKYPDRIQLLLHAANIGMKANHLAVLNACRGDYIAYLEGDDYWTSPRKLRRQVAALEARPDASFCFHNTQIIFDDDPGQNYLSHPEPPAEVTVHDMFQRWSIMTSSIVLRRAFLLPLPSWAIEINQADKMLQLLLAARGPVLYVDEVMSVYRRHPAGMTQVFSDPLVYLEDSIRLFTHFNEWSEGKYAEEIHRYLAMWYFGSAVQHRHRGEYALCLRDALHHFRHARPLSPAAAANAMRKLILSKEWNESLSGSRVGTRLKKLL